MNAKDNTFLFVGDVHGLDATQLIRDNLNIVDKIILLGDYVDSFFVKASEQLYNLKQLCNLGRKNKDKVFFLLGNHDYAYLHGYYGITGYQHLHYPEYRKIFVDNQDLFKIAWGYTNFNTKKYTLATHAGLTQTYWNKFIEPTFKKENPDHEPIQIHEVLNSIQDKDLIWKVGSMRGGTGTPGILWADYLEFIEDPYAGINQVFGHTPRPTVTMNHNGDDFYVCIDDWGNKNIKSMMITL